MKLSILTVIAVSVATAAQAGTISFTEQYTEQSSSSAAVPEPTVTSQTDKAQFSAFWQVQGLEPLNADTNAQFSVKIGGWSWSAQFADASKSSSNSVTFVEKVGTNKPTGVITFTRRGETLVVSGASSAISPSIVAESFKGDRGATNGQVDATISVGSVSLNEPLFYTANSSVFTRKTSGKTNVTDSVSVMGATDTVSPIVVLLPVSGKHTAGDHVVVTAKAWDNVQVASVWISNNSTNAADYVEAVKGAKGYQSTVTLAAGVNTIRAIAIDAAGNKSKTAVLRVSAKAK